MKAYYINIGLIIALALGVGIFDVRLNLGEFHGLVFKLYLLYGSIILAIINLIIAIILALKHKKHTAFNVIKSALIASGIGCIVAYIA